MSGNINTATAVNPLNIKAVEAIQSADNNPVLLADTGVVKVTTVAAADNNNDQAAEQLLTQARGYWDTWAAKNKEIESILKKIHPTDSSVSPLAGDQLTALTNQLDAASAEQALAVQNWTRTVTGLVALKDVSKNISADIADYLSQSGKTCLSMWGDANAAIEQIQKSSTSTWVIETSAEGGSRGAAVQGLASVLRGLLAVQPSAKNAATALNDLLREISLVTSIPNQKTTGINIEEQLKGLFRTGLVPDATLWSGMATALGDIQENYVNVYKNATSKYVQFQADFNEEVRGKLSTYIEAPKIEGQVNKDNAAQFIYFRAGALQWDARELYKKYFDENTGLAKDRAVLFPDQAAGSALTGKSKSEAEQWAKDMGLSVEHCVRQLPDGKYIVQIDPVPLKTIIDGLSGKGGNIRTQLYDSWHQLFEAQAEDISKSTQALAQQYSHAISVYDNLQKILSALIDACLAVARDCLKP